MFYPDWLREGDTIGVTACSDGISKPVDTLRLQYAANHFVERGYPVVMTPDVYTSIDGRSQTAAKRAEELHALIEDPSVKVIMQLMGGEYLVEMLPYVDFTLTALHPKWYQGYSDATGLLHALTTITDTSTIYASNFLEFSMNPWHRSLFDNLRLLKGEEFTQSSDRTYQDGFAERVTGQEGYRMDKAVKYYCKKGKAVRGRMLGGCLDALIDVCGTRYDQTAQWCRRYQEDGVLWYLESFDLSRERLTRGLWKLREAEWFRHAAGFIFGRPAIFDGDEQEYMGIVSDVLSGFDVPIITEADVGHKPPRFTMMNGSIGVILVDCELGQLRQSCR